MPSDASSSLVKILETDSLTDIALIKSVLEAEQIDYLLQGEHMKFIRPFDPVVLFVTEGDAARTAELMKQLDLTYHWMRWA